MNCYYCGKENISNANFCSGCGKQLKGDRVDFENANKKHFVQTIILFLSIVLVIVFSFAEYTDLPLLTHEYVFNGLLLLITLIYIFFDFRSFFALFKLRIRSKPILETTIAAPMLAIIVVVVADLINSAFGIEQSKYYLGYQLYTPNMYTYGILFVAVMPGFIEEMLFRGILFNYLLKFTRPKLVILITSILFAFIHFSFVSIPWLFFIGLILGYLRFRYRTIWYGIYFHCLYNASVFFIEFFI